MTKIMKGGLSYCATSNMVALTQAQYDALSTAQKNNGNFYFITDANPSYFSAANIDYDNTDSGLSATDIQGAIDEVIEEKADRVPMPAEYNPTSTYSSGDVVTYNNAIYQCNTFIDTAEAWNPAHWDLVTPDTDYLHSVNPTGNGSFSLNRKANTAVGRCSFAEGYNTTASGTDSHAEGYSTKANGICAHAEGSSTTASNSSAHAEGYSTSASGGNSHAEGNSSVASELSSHAEGYYTSASGRASHSEGYYTTANHHAQHVFGEYNVLDDSTATASNRGNYVEIVGNGTGSSARSNARTLDWSGNEVLSGGLTATGCSISNTSNPRVSITADATVGGSITLYNIYNSKVIDINNTASKSQMDFYHASLGGLSGVSIYTGSGYGTVSARGTSTSTSSAYISGSNYGSRVGVSTLTGASCGELIGGSTGGSLVLKDHNTTTNITLDGSTGDIACSTINSYNTDRIRCIERYTGGNSKTWSVTVDSSVWTCGLLIANTNNGGDGVWFVYKQNASDAVVISNIAVNPGNPTGFTAAISGTTLTFTCSGSISFRRCTWIGLN